MRKHLPNAVARCLRGTALVGLFSLVFACSHAPKGPPMAAVPNLDLASYAGRWFEIASIPHPRQTDCTATEARYELRAKNDIRVTNSCHRGSVSGPLTEIEGRAWLPDPNHPGQLKVQLIWPFRGDYWVLGHAGDYSWAVVGQPSRRYLWLLSRTRHVSADTLAEMRAIAEQQHYDLSALRLTAQPPDGV